MLMLKSMTGYGKAECILGDSVWQIELRTVNSKVLDFNCRVPQLFKAFENEIRKIIAKHLQRGKVDLLLSMQNNASTISHSQIDQEVVKNYYEQLQALSVDVSVPLGSNVLSDILRLPDVLRPVEECLTEDDIDKFFKALAQACVDLDDFRRHEGKSLQQDFNNRIGVIANYLEQINAIKDNRIIRLRERFAADLEKYFGQIPTDDNRLEQEIIYYIEKLDITEEIVRLHQHLQYFSDTMDMPESQGKKLNFITQEIGREINTIGSKANDAEMQHLVVNMKDELEKIKEQMLNIL